MCRESCLELGVALKTVTVAAAMWTLFSAASFASGAPGMYVAPRPIYFHSISAPLNVLPLGGHGSGKKKRGQKMLNPRDLNVLKNAYGKSMLTFRDVGWVVEISRLGRVFGMARYSEVVEIFGRYE